MKTVQFMNRSFIVEEWANFIGQDSGGTFRVFRDKPVRSKEIWYPSQDVRDSMQYSMIAYPEPHMMEILS